MKRRIESTSHRREISPLIKTGALATAALLLSGCSVDAKSVTHSEKPPRAVSQLEYELRNTFMGTVDRTGIAIDTATIGTAVDGGRGEVSLHIKGADINHKVYDDETLPHYTVTTNPIEIAIGPQGQRENGIITWSNRAGDVAEMHPWLNFGKTLSTHDYEISLAAYGELPNGKEMVAEYNVGEVALTGIGNQLKSVKVIPAIQEFTLAGMDEVPQQVMFGMSPSNY